MECEICHKDKEDVSKTAIPNKGTFMACGDCHDKAYGC